MCDVNEAGLQHLGPPIVNAFALLRWFGLDLQIKRSTPFSKVTATWYQREGVASGSYKFLYEGRDIKDTDTAESVSRPIGSPAAALVGCRPGSDAITTPAEHRDPRAEPRAIVDLYNLHLLIRLLQHVQLQMDMEVDDNGEVVVDAMLGQTGGAQRQLQYNEH